MSTQAHLPPQTVPTNLFTLQSGPSNTLPVVTPSEVSSPPTRRFTAAELASRAFGGQQVHSIGSSLVDPTPHAAPTNLIPVLLPVHVGHTLPNMTPTARPTHQHAMPRVSVIMLKYNYIMNHAGFGGMDTTTYINRKQLSIS